MLEGAAGADGPSPHGCLRGRLVGHLRGCLRGWLGDGGPALLAEEVIGLGRVAVGTVGGHGPPALAAESIAGEHLVPVHAPCHRARTSPPAALQQRTEPGAAGLRAYDPGIARRLWEVSEERTGIRYDAPG